MIEEDALKVAIRSLMKLYKILGTVETGYGGVSIILGLSFIVTDIDEYTEFKNQLMKLQKCTSIPINIDERFW